MKLCTDTKVWRHKKDGFLVGAKPWEYDLTFSKYELVSKRLIEGTEESKLPESSWDCGCVLCVVGRTRLKRV